MKKLSIILGLVIAAEAAWAEPQLTGVGTPYWSGTLTCSGTDACVKTSTASGAPCALFIAGKGRSEADKRKVVHAVAADELTICPTLSSSVTISGMSISDPGYSGPGRCYKLVTTGQVQDFRLNWHDLRYTATGAQAPGAVDGICEGTLESAGDLLYPPCSSTGAGPSCDGTWGLTGTGATCDTSPETNQRDLAGAILMCEAPSSSALYLTKEIVVEAGRQ